MSADDQEALQALHRRLMHVAHTARILAVCVDPGVSRTIAMEGIGATLTELASRLDGVIDPGGAA